MYSQEKLVKVLQYSMDSILRSYNFIEENPFISVIHVDLNSNFSNAHFFLSFFGTKKNPKEILIEIQKKIPQIRFLLGKKIKSKVRKIPEIHFHLETFLEKAFSLEKTLKNLEKNT